MVRGLVLKIDFLFVAEWAELNHRDSSSGSDVIESGSVSGEVAMDTGNPWDSKPLAASTVTPFDNPFDSPAKSGGINPNPKVDEGWANFSSPAHSAQKLGTAATKTLDEDSEMSPVKADFEAAFGSGSEDAPGGVASAAPGVLAVGSTEAATNQDSDLVVTSSPKKSPTVTTTEENIP